MANENVWRNRAIAVAKAPKQADFSRLVRLSGLDPRTDFRFADWSGVSFRDCDLSGFDFTGAQLVGCDFTGAWITGARFDQAMIDHARPNSLLDPKRTIQIGIRGSSNMYWEFSHVSGMTVVYMEEFMQASTEHMPAEASRRLP